MATPNWQALQNLWQYGSGNPNAETKAQFEQGGRVNDAGWIEKLKYQYEKGTPTERRAIEEVMAKKEQEGWNPGVGDAFGIGALKGIADRVDERDLKAWADEQKAAADERTKKADEESQRASLTDRINQYVKAMQEAPDANDPVMKGLAAQGADAGQQAYGGWGAGGSGLGRLSNVASQRLSLPYLQHRQDLAAQGMGLLNNRDISLGQLQLGADEMGLKKAQWQNQLQQQNFAAAQQREMGGWGIAGGLLGLGGGIASAFIPGVGAAGALKAIPSLMQGGSTMFQGMGASGPQWNGGKGWGSGGGTY